jgi:signal transduction histidine kinase
LSLQRFTDPEAAARDLVQRLARGQWTASAMDRALFPAALLATMEGAAGLGLSQAYAFARQSGGVLSIDSNPGEGAEVSITLPQGG